MAVVRVTPEALMNVEPLTWMPEGLAMTTSARWHGDFDGAVEEAGLAGVDLAEDDAGGARR
ncbi:hypothetical protein Q5W_10775 [Hydrogenophaga sp. PBC]|nr:hypothetical protein Q5W_10775 [Hydrogenophaga sp. PBC]